MTRRSTTAPATTIRDIARLADVSPATVSRVMNGVVAVAPATVERVRAVAATLGWTPNPMASQLSRTRKFVTATIDIDGETHTIMGDAAAIDAVTGALARR